MPQLTSAYGLARHTALLLLLLAVGESAGEVPIDPKHKAQVFRHWGTNLNVFAASIDYRYQAAPAPGKAALVEQLGNELFDPAGGIGFNSVRIFARTGQSREILDLLNREESDSRTGFPLSLAAFRFGTPWVRPNGTYLADSDYDPTQLALAAIARRHDANARFEVRGQAAPFWMTRSGNAAGYRNPVTGAVEPNLLLAQFDSYTRYLARMAARLIGMGYRVEAVSPTEEGQSPPKPETVLSGSNPGDFFPARYPVPGEALPENHQARLYRRLRRALDEQGLVGVKTVGPNEASPRGTRLALEEYTPEDLAEVDIVGTHGYQADHNWELEGSAPLIRLKELAGGREIQVTEDDVGNAYREDGAFLDWESNLRLCFKAASYIKHLGATAWHVWNPGNRMFRFEKDSEGRYDGRFTRTHQFHLLRFLVAAFPAGTTVIGTPSEAVLAGIRGEDSGGDSRKFFRILITHQGSTDEEFRLAFPTHGIPRTAAIRTLTAVPEAEPVAFPTSTAERTATTVLQDGRWVLELRVPAQSITSVVIRAY